MPHDRVDPVAAMRAKANARNNPDNTSPWAMDAEAPPSVFPVPLWAERMGLVGDLPQWMMNQDGNATVDISVALRRPSYNPDGTPVDQRDICRQFWASGKCKTADEGLTCFFKHERDPEVLAKKQAKKERKRAKEAQEAAGMATPSKPKATGSGAAQQQFCRNFKFRGTCKFGDNCKYIHEE